MAYVTDHAVCLRVTDFSETSQIVAMFTREHGLMPLLAKGAKRQSATGAGKMSGPLDLLAAGEVVFIPPKGGDLGTLCGWELTDQRNGIRRSLAALHAGFMAAEITLAVLHPHDPNMELMAELEAALALIPGGQRPRAVVAYAKAALTVAGYKPQLAACAGCGEAISMEGSYRYSPVAGGVLCGTCGRASGRDAGKMMGVSGRIIIALERLPSPRGLQEHPPGRGADAGALRTAMEVLLFHLEGVLDRRLRTRAFLGDIFGGG